MSRIDENDSMMVFTARHRLERAAKYYAPGDPARQHELETAAMALQNALRHEENMQETVVLSIDEFDETESTKTYEECGVDLKEVG